MPKLYRPREVIRVLEFLGWVYLRTRGDHARYSKPEGTYPTTIPTSRREIGPKEFSYILKQTGLTRREFEEAANEVL
ncbi:MAG: type II toxin-antitoxin system HicA family toxin [Chloroflexi bacterium]|nr:type II toxin-antitoxin system HicA family toxin [Chloroflexota bacterium]